MVNDNGRVPEMNKMLQASGYNVTIGGITANPNASNEEVGKELIRSLDAIARGDYELVNPDEIVDVPMPVTTERKSKAILHIQMGDENFKPSTEQLQAITKMFESALNDPRGAVISTNHRIKLTVLDVKDVDEVRINKL